MHLARLHYTCWRFCGITNYIVIFYFLQQCDQFNKTSNYLPVSDCTEVTNCMYNFDVGKYDAQIKALRRLLQNTIKHLYRTNKVISSV